MKKLLLFLVAVIATLGLHAEKVALITAGNSATFDLDVSVNAHPVASGTVGSKDEGSLKNKAGIDVIDYNFENVLFNNNTKNLDIRFYTGKSYSFTPKPGYILTSIVFNASSNNYAKVSFTGSENNPGSFSTNGSTQTWEGSTENTVTFSATGTTRFNSIVITYESTGPKEPVDYNNIPEAVDAIVGQTITLDLGELHPEISWQSANENIAYVDEDNVLHAVGKGQTTITASWDAVAETWNAGSSQIKVTVN
ncbi:MAG: hypothetical protein K2M61_08245, partial [Muribaculaceae bacterium]|nr:hypothetical protein [Muribaculaceae bacterium]